MCRGSIHPASRQIWRVGLLPVTLVGDTAHPSPRVVSCVGKAMSIDEDYLRLVQVLAAALPPAEVTGLYLPPLVEDGAYRDEFGFVFLSDHSVGPFYASLDPILRTLWRRYPRPGEVRADPIVLGRALEGGDLAERALAIGAFNALSRSLVRRAGFEPPDRGARKEVPAASSGAPVGIVGYFWSRDRPPGLCGQGGTGPRAAAGAGTGAARRAADHQGGGPGAMPTGAVHRIRADQRHARRALGRLPGLGVRVDRADRKRLAGRSVRPRRAGCRGHCLR